MKKNILDLDYIINADNYRNIQDSIADATDAAIITVDYKGKPITHHSKCSELCKIIRANPEYSQICEKCDSRGGLEATRLSQPYIYLCHMGIVDFAIPITVNGQYLGAVMGGQVLLDDNADEKYLEKITSQKTNALEIMDKDKLEHLYGLLPKMSLQKIKSIAAMIYNISNYIVEEALLKISLSDESDMDGNSPDTGKSFDSSIITQSEINRDNIILRPALEYIQKNYAKNISLDNMASICNISSSYFSKLFNRVVGDNFANYVNKIRVGKAKELLKTTDLPITSIAMDLGFEDSGYFVKVFKKIEGVTPSTYRNFKSN